MSDIVQTTRQAVERHMDQIAERFVDGARVTVIVRIPGNNEADFMVTADTIDEVGALIERMKERQR